LTTVSFIVIARNAERYLGSLLSDLSAQNYPHDKIQVVLVDSNSCDGTKRIITNFSGDFADIVRLDNPEATLPHGWNVAIPACTGDILVRLDAHSHIEGDFISNVVACMEGGEDIVGGQRISVFEQGSIWRALLAHAECSAFGSGIAAYRREHERKYVKTLAHAAYRREVFEAVGPYDTRLSRTEDNEIHHRMHKAGYKFALCPEIVSYHHVRASLRGMLRQKFGNGFWIGLTLSVCPHCFSLYNFVPLCFVLALILGTPLAFIIGLPLLALAVPALYLIAAVMAMVAEVAKEKHFLTALACLILPFIFLIMHLFYGFGTLFGIIHIPFWKKRSKK
jgi:cellulose synthase/poly-beta-1,6-N-acetylglucosamine synthase-like glycosyltransferase